ncbi:MAG: hypothetical protein O3A51_06845, partial [Verrucomicrobia bacterium]|nr:hypothetical protein [Verrucomicrobiota bacterium]
MGSKKQRHSYRYIVWGLLVLVTVALLYVRNLTSTAGLSFSDPSDSSQLAPNRSGPVSDDDPDELVASPAKASKALTGAAAGGP